VNDVGRAGKVSKPPALGFACKRDIDDGRESPALDVISLLRARGSEVSYHAPYIPSVRMGEDDRGIAPADAPILRSVPFEKLDGYDAVVVVTDHSSFDYERLAREARLIVDTRNATRKVREGARARIVTI